MIDWTNAQSADGPSVVAWLDAHNLEWIDTHGATARRIREWRSGSRASIVALDKVMIDLDLHLSELPDHVWRADKRARFDGSQETCHACGVLHDDKTPGCNSCTRRHWWRARRRKLKAAAA